MAGFFEVRKEGERYSGTLKEKMYHGHGKLINEEGFVEGEFSHGKLVYASYRTTENDKAEK
jgi:hypothetical protein